MAIKVGTEDKKKVYLAGGLGLVMLILLVRFLWQNFSPSPSPAPGIPPPVVTTSRQALLQAAKRRKRTAAREFMPTRRPRSAAWPRLTLRCIRRSCARPSRLNIPALGATSSPCSLRPRPYPNPSLPSARRMSIPVHHRHRHHRLSIWVSMDTRRRRPGKNKSSCCTAMISLSPRRGM